MTVEGKWVFGEPPLPDGGGAGGRAARPHRHRPLARAVVARSWKRWCRPCATRSGSWRRRRRPICAHESATTRRPSDACTSTTATPSATTTRASRRTRSRSDGRRGAHGTVEFPVSYEGPPGHRARRVPRGLLRLRAAGAQLHARPRGQDRRAVDPVPATDAVADAAHVPRRARSSTAAASPRTPSSSSATSCSAKRTSRGEGRPRDAPDGVGAPDMTAPTTVSRVLRAHVAERPDARLRRVRRRPAHLRRRRTPQPARSLVGCSRPGPGAAAASVCSSRPASTSCSPGSPRCASARSPSRSARSPPSRELRDLFARADVDLAARRDRVPRATTTPPRSTTPSASRRRRRRARTVAPHLRHVWLDGFAALEALAADVPDALLDAIEDDVTARRPHGHRAHVGVHERAEGRDPPARPAARTPRHAERAPRPRRRRRASSRTRRCSGSVASRTTSSACSSPGATLLCSAATDPVETLDFIERERPGAHQRLRGVDRGAGRAPDVRVARLLVDPLAATSIRSCPQAIRPDRPRAAPQHARHDRDRQRVPHERRRDRPARAPARLVRAPGARARRRGSSIPRRWTDCAGRRASASCGSAARRSWRATTGASATRSSRPTAGTAPATCSTSTPTASSTSTAGAAT